MRWLRTVKINKVSLRDAIMNGCLTCRHPSPRTLERRGSFALCAMVCKQTVGDEGSALDNANNLRRTRRSRNKSFGRAFSPRRARLRIAKAFRIRITPPERQNKNFGRAFLKARGVQRQRLWARSAERETPQRQELRRGESDKTIRRIVFRRGAPCDRGRP